MFPLFASSFSYKKFFKFDEAKIDNKVFKLHYRITCLLLVVCCVIVTTKQLFDEPITCYTAGKDIIPKEVLNTFCWIQSTFTVPTKAGDPAILAPGVRTSTSKDKRIVHKYYQWVGLVLIFQAIGFYLPHFIWKCAEGKRLKSLRQDLHLPYRPEEDASTEEEKVSIDLTTKQVNVTIPYDEKNNKKFTVDVDVQKKVKPPAYHNKNATNSDLNQTEVNINVKYNDTEEKADNTGNREGINNEWRTNYVKVPDINTKVRAKLQSLSKFIVEKRGTYNCYAFTYFACEILNFLLVGLQIWAIDNFLGNEFFKYGLRVIGFLNMDQDKRDDPMILVFPRLSKCVFHNYGPSGELQTHDALCILPLNIANEKIYVVIWFWFAIVGIFSALVIIYRVPIVLSSHLRAVFAVRFYCHHADLTEMCQIYRTCDAGDWLLLTRLSQNLEADNFRVLIHLIYDKLLSKGIIKLNLENVEKMSKNDREKENILRLKGSKSSVSSPKQIKKFCCC